MESKGFIQDPSHDPMDQQEAGSRILGLCPKPSGFGTTSCPWDKGLRKDRPQIAIRGMGDNRKQQGKDEKTSINICALGALSYIPYPPSYWKILATSTSPLVSRVCRSHRSEDIASLRLLLTPKTLPDPKPSHGTVPQTAAGAGSDPALGRADGSDGFLWPIPNFV